MHVSDKRPLRSAKVQRRWKLVTKITVDKGGFNGLPE